MLSGWEHSWDAGICWSPNDQVLSAVRGEAWLCWCWCCCWYCWAGRRSAVWFRALLPGGSVAGDTAGCEPVWCSRAGSMAVQMMMMFCRCNQVSVIHDKVRVTDTKHMLAFRLMSATCRQSGCAGFLTGCLEHSMLSSFHVCIGMRRWSPRGCVWEERKVSGVCLFAW